MQDFRPIPRFYLIFTAAIRFNKVFNALKLKFRRRAIPPLDRSSQKQKTLNGTGDRQNICHVKARKKLKKS